LVSQSGTTVAKFFKFFTKKPYNHVSVSDDLKEFHSFCRTYIHSPIPATFNKEVTTVGVWGHMKHIPCELYELEVTEEQKAVFDGIIDEFRKNRKKYAYNIIGIAALYWGINWKRENKFLCSQFCAHVLDKMGIKLNKPVFLHIPEDFRHIEDFKLVYEGNLKDYEMPSVNYALEILPQ
jgi:hypothetical protein